MVEDRMVTASTQRFWWSRHVPVHSAARIAASSQGLALGLITADAYP
jgi:hypothetical protein